MQAYMRTRDDYPGPVQHLPASAPSIVAGFAREELSVEIGVSAAAPA